MGGLKVFIRRLSILLKAPSNYSSTMGVNLLFRMGCMAWLYSRFFLGSACIKGAYDTNQFIFCKFGLARVIEACSTRIILMFRGVGIKPLCMRVSARSQSTFPAIGQPCRRHRIPGLRQLLRMLEAATARFHVFRPLPQSTAPPPT